MSYIGIVCLLILLCGITQLHPRFLTRQWRCKRMALYASVALFGFLPFMHWCIVSSHETVMVLQLTEGFALCVMLFVFSAAILSKNTCSLCTWLYRSTVLCNEIPRDFHSRLCTCLYWHGADRCDLIICCQVGLTILEPVINGGICS